MATEIAATRPAISDISTRGNAKKLAVIRRQFRAKRIEPGILVRIGEFIIDCL
jgi:hypothetical protein